MSSLGEALSVSAYELCQKEFDSYQTRRNYVITAYITIVGALAAITRFVDSGGQYALMVGLIPFMGLASAWVCMHADAYLCKQIVVVANRGLEAEEKHKPEIRFFDTLDADFPWYSVSRVEALCIIGSTFWVFFVLKQTLA